MSFRAEVRESIRDELANQNTRFNNVMLRDANSGGPGGPPGLLGLAIA